jgi:hypothetical protein
MKLGWSAVAIALTAAVSGVMLAVRSVRSAPDFQFWGMEYRQFLLVMLTEMAVYTGFVAAGLWFRKRPDIHRSMLLLASISVLAGATVRTPVFFPIFGQAGWIGIFGPIFTLGVLFLLVRAVTHHVVDRSFAAGYIIMVVAYIFAAEYAVSDTWTACANRLI